MSRLGDTFVRLMEEAWPEAPLESSLPSSCIVGLIHIKEQRRGHKDIQDI